jgi:hypothetical protein
MALMNFRLSIAALAACATLTGVAASEGVDLSKSRSIAVSSAQRTAAAPFVAHAGDPLPELLFRQEQDRRGPSGACEFSASDLCYDLADGRMVYRPARQYMPKIGGLTPESVSLRRDRLTFRYSFR